jgi:hypothetical protein
MAKIASTKAEVKSSNLLKACFLSFVAATGSGLTILPAHADVTIISRSRNSATVSGNNSSVRQGIQQKNIQQSDGKNTGDSISIQDAKNNATASGDNNHIEQGIQQSSEQQIGSNDESGKEQISRQNAENNAHTSGKNNRIQQRIDQSILLQRNFRR